MLPDNLPFAFQVKKVLSCGLRMVLGIEQRMKIFLESFILSPSLAPVKKCLELVPRLKVNF